MYGVTSVSPHKEIPPTLEIVPDFWILKDSDFSCKSAYLLLLVIRRQNCSKSFARLHDRVYLNLNYSTGHSTPNRATSAVVHSRRDSVQSLQQSQQIVSAHPNLCHIYGCAVPTFADSNPPSATLGQRLSNYPVLYQFSTGCASSEDTPYNQRRRTGLVAPRHTPSMNTPYFSTIHHYRKYYFGKLVMIL